VGFQSILNFLTANDRSDLWPQFVQEIDKLDQLRGEDFWATFPELAVLND
jgi:hypothetical protein